MWNFKIMWTLGFISLSEIWITIFLKGWFYFVLWSAMKNENIKLNNKITLDFAPLWLIAYHKKDLEN